jgi:hypothetical protein
MAGGFLLDDLLIRYSPSGFFKLVNFKLEVLSHTWPVLGKWHDTFTASRVGARSKALGKNVENTCSTIFTLLQFFL